MARRRHHSRSKKSIGKKILIGILAILLVFIIGVGAVGAKLYFDVKGTADDTYKQVDRSNEPTATKRSSEVDLTKSQPFSVLLLGIDTGDLGRTDQGRSDTMIAATVNSTTNKTTLVSLERDTYTEIVGHGTTEKLNAAYAYGGVPMAMDTVESLVDVPIDHYITINLKGLKQLVDAVGGITVANDLSFTYEGTTFSIGTNELDGDKALKYSRMRYDDPAGDYGRQKRQRRVITAIAKKVLSMDGISNYKTILDAMGDNVTTDLKFSDMTAIAKNYREAFKSIDEEQLHGEGFMQDGVSYQKASDAELNRISLILKEQLDLN
jgi:LCP family protein required for cell wall assembly